MSPDITEIRRIIENLICFAMVTETDYRNARVRVEIAGRPSAWLPWATANAAADRHWNAPEPGEQVIVACPSGDPANGVVLCALFRAGAPADTADITRHVFGDGMVLEHDRSRNRTRISALDNGGTLVIEAKNLILRTGEKGYYQIDNHGLVSRLTHAGGANFDAEAWTQGSNVTGQPDHGYSPPKVPAPDEDDGGA